MNTAEHSTANRAYWAQVITLGLVVGLGLQFAQAAWTSPTASAPNGNVSGPITTSATTQNKSGILLLGGLGVSGGAVFKSTGSVLFEGKTNCDLETNASGELTCGTDQVGTGDITGIVTPPNTGLTGGAMTGDVTLRADTNYLQRKITGPCDSGEAIRNIAANGQTTCVPVGAPQGSWCGLSKNVGIPPTGWTNARTCNGASIASSCPSGYTSVTISSTAGDQIKTCMKT